MVVDGNHRHAIFSNSFFLEGPLARSILVSHSAMRAANVRNLVFTKKKQEQSGQQQEKTHTSPELAENENEKPLAENAGRQHRILEKTGQNQQNAKTSSEPVQNQQIKRNMRDRHRQRLPTR